MLTEHGIGTYPVGLLSDLQHRRKFLYMLHYLVRRTKCGHWRAIHNYFNGYLAEWHYPPADIRITRCGHGWTRKRALRKFGKYLVRDNMSIQEQVYYD